ncbi:MAG: transcription factor S [Promethearchaeota archaeon]
MEYCPECDSLLYPKKIDGIKYFVCKACGYKRNFAESKKDAFVLKEKLDHSLDRTLVKDDKYYEKVYGADKAKVCPRCKGKMILKSLQTRSADEGITHFWICVKCNKSIRIYS